MTELILALDVTDHDQALAIAGACAPHIDGIKVGYPLVLACGLGIVQEFAPFGLPLIADFKVADIPNTNRLICEQVFAAGVDAIIAHGFPGGDSIRACVETAHDREGACYVVAEMSHPGAVEFFQGVSERIALLAVSCGADGIIAPATRPDHVQRLRSIVGTRRIYAPGIGAQGGDLEQVVPLVDGVIVGRAIYGAADPAEAARRFTSIRR